MEVGGGLEGDIVMWGRNALSGLMLSVGGMVVSGVRSGQYLEILEGCLFRHRRISCFSCFCSTFSAFGLLKKGLAVGCAEPS